MAAATSFLTEPSTSCLSTGLGTLTYLSNSMALVCEGRELVLNVSLSLNPQIYLIHSIKTRGKSPS